MRRLCRAVFASFLRRASPGFDSGRDKNTRGSPERQSRVSSCEFQRRSTDNSTLLSRTRTNGARVPNTTNLVKPANPSEPVNLLNPANPLNSANPLDPANPPNPANPCNLVNSPKPANPINPVILPNSAKLLNPTILPNPANPF